LLDQPNDAVSLGRILLPILESGALLVHPDTFPRAASLLKATAPAGGSSAQIEAAIANAINLAEKNEVGEYTKNVLLGCLGESDISDPGLAQRREGLGGSPPEIPPPLSILSETSPWSSIDQLKKQGVPLTESVESGARNLDAVLKEFQRGAATSPDTTARLIEAFMTADAAFADAQSVPPELERLLVNAAARLAYASATTPDSPHGMVVLKVLNDGAAHPDAGSFLE
jgi:exonuclease VII small subunit